MLEFTLGVRQASQNSSVTQSWVDERAKEEEEEEPVPTRSSIRFSLIRKADDNPKPTWSQHPVNLRDQPRNDPRPSIGAHDCIRGALQTNYKNEIPDICDSSTEKFLVENNVKSSNRKFHPRGIHRLPLHTL